MADNQRCCICHEHRPECDCAIHDAPKVEYFRVSRGGSVLMYGRRWKAWPWSCWVKVRKPEAAHGR